MVIIILILVHQLARQRHGVVAIGLYEDGVLIPDTVRAVTITAPDDYQSISFNRKLRICPKGNTSITVGSVPTVPTPSTPATPITTQIPIITNATFNLARSNEWWIIMMETLKKYLMCCKF